MLIDGKVGKEGNPLNEDSFGILSKSLLIEPVVLEVEGSTKPISDEEAMGATRE